MIINPRKDSLYMSSWTWWTLSLTKIMLPITTWNVYCQPIRYTILVKDKTLMFDLWHGIIDRSSLHEITDNDVRATINMIWHCWNTQKNTIFWKHLLSPCNILLILVCIGCGKILKVLEYPTIFFIQCVSVWVVLQKYPLKSCSG